MFRCSTAWRSLTPKRSMVDIIQAVGRVIRKAVGKHLGTIIIPVFIDESKDADHVLSQSAFEPVWQVLKALRTLVRTAGVRAVRVRRLDRDAAIGFHARSR